MVSYLVAVTTNHESPSKIHIIKSYILTMNIRIEFANTLVYLNTKNSLLFYYNYVGSSQLKFQGECFGSFIPILLLRNQVRSHIKFPSSFFLVNFLV